MNFIKEKVLLINPPTPQRRKFVRNADCAAESKGNYLMQPYDFLLLSGVFDANTRVEFVDSVALEIDFDQAIKKSLCLPNLIITATIDALWLNDLTFLKALREQHPETPILTFGDALIEDGNSQKVLQYADGIIMSPFSFYIENAKSWTRDEFKQNAQAIGLRTDFSYKNLNKKTTIGRNIKPRHELFLHSRYRWPFGRHKKFTTITTNWGCPYVCSYCTASSIASLYRNHSEMLEELNYIKKLGLKEIYFSDKTFGIPLENTITLLNSMIEKNLNFSWSTYFHPNNFSEDLLVLMKKSGCHTVIIGVETNDLVLLKKYNRHISKAKLNGLLECCRRLEIEVCGDFIIGFPEHSKEDVLNTIKYSLSLNLDYASFNVATPLPNSSFKKYALENNIITNSDHEFDSSGQNRIMHTNHIASSELKFLHSYANKMFYGRPRYLLGRLKKIKSFEHFIIQFEEMLQLIKKNKLKISE